MLRRAVLSGALSSAAIAILPPVLHATPQPQSLPSTLVGDVLRLKGRVSLGSAQPDVTLIEFFDYNCPYCRNSSREIAPLLKVDKNLRYVLVNYAVLSEASILASKVALAFSMQMGSRYLSFHQKLFEHKGMIGADQSIDVAIALGANKARLLKDADSDAVTQALIGSAKLGENLGLIATPSYILGNEALQGYVSLAEKTEVIKNMRVCEKLAC